MVLSVSDASIPLGEVGLLGMGSGKATVKECKWCLRTDECENPLEYQRRTKPCLPWRRPFGRECGNCPWVIATDDKYWSMSKAQLEEELRTDPEKRKEFIEKVHRWEGEKNRTGGSRTKRAAASAYESVEARTTSALQTRMSLGWLWPTAVFTREKGRKPTKKELTRVQHQGKSVVGVLLNEAGPAGCIEVSSFGEKSVGHSVTLASSSNQTSEEIDQSYQAAAKRSCVAVATASGGNLALKQVAAKRRRDDDSDNDDSILDQLWGKRMCAGGGGGSGAMGSEMSVQSTDDGGDAAAEEDGESKPTPRKRVHNQKDLPCRASPPVPAKPPPKPMTPTRAQMSRELDSAEQVALRCTQFLKGLADRPTALTLTVKAHAALLANLEARLNSEHVAIYSSQYEAGSCTSDRGMKVLEELRGHQAKIPMLREMMVAIHATEGPASTSAVLRAELARVKAHDIVVSSVVKEMVFARAAAEAVAKEAFTDLGLMLDFRNHETNMADVCVAQFAEDEAKDRQRSSAAVPVQVAVRVDTQSSPVSTSARSRVSPIL